MRGYWGLGEEDRHMNSIILIGHLTRDPELRFTPSGAAVTSFGLAVNRRFKQGEELKQEVCFVDVLTFGKQAETLSQYLSKGSKVAVEGRLQQQTWEKDGKKHSKHEVVANQVEFLDKKGGGDHGTH